MPVVIAQLKESSVPTAAVRISLCTTMPTKSDTHSCLLQLQKSIVRQQYQYDVVGFVLVAILFTAVALFWKKIL